MLVQALAFNSSVSKNGDSNVFVPINLVSYVVELTVYLMFKSFVAFICSENTF